MSFRNFIAALFATYMFALVLLPCNDTCNTFQDKTTTSQNTSHDHHQGTEDACSPFCFCACCSTVATPMAFYSYAFVPALAVHDFSLLPQAFYSKDQSSIWQPPKLS